MYIEKPGSWMHRGGDFCTRFELFDILPSFDKVMFFSAMAYFVRLCMEETIAAS
jgi:hypothetical protein